MPMPTSTPWEYTLYIPHDPRAVGICRRALRDILTSHHLSALADPAELLASELLGNAIRHTGGPAALKLRRSGSALRLGAWDTDPTPPSPAEPKDGGADRESGRGLRIVHAYADDWGWFRINGDGGNGGKYVWCELGAELGAEPADDHRRKA